MNSMVPIAAVALAVDPRSGGRHREADPDLVAEAPGTTPFRPPDEEQRSYGQAVNNREAWEAEAEAEAENWIKFARTLSTTPTSLP
jgi:hypothetical protein